jgi:MFS family permease
VGIWDKIGLNRVVIALSAARMGDAVGNSILFILIPLYVAHLPSPLFPFPESVRAGFLISWYGLIAAIFQPFAGVFIDRLNRRKLFIQSGLIVMAAATLAFTLAGRFTDLFVLRTLQGLGVSFTIPASVALLAISTERRTRGGSMGIFTTSRMLGLAIGPILGGYLYEHFGFHPSFYAGGGFIVLGIVLVQLWVREAPPPGKTEKKIQGRMFDRNVLDPGIIGSGLATFVMASAFSMITPLESQFNQRLGQGALAFGIALSSLMFSRFLFQIPLGRLSDRVGRKPLIIAGILVMIPATVLLGEVQTTLQLILLRVVQGIGASGVAAPAFALAGDRAGRGSEGRQMSIPTMGFGLGIAAGPLISGILSVLFFSLPFWIGGLMLAAAAWVIHRYVPESVERG